MKKFIISADVLAKVLNKLAHAVSPKAVLPALANIYCKVSAKSVELIASDTETTIRYRCECDTPDDLEAFEFLVPFAILSKIVTLNKKSPLTFTSAKNLKISGEFDTYEIKPSVKIEEFPKLQEVPKKNNMPLDKLFLHWLTLAQQTVSKDETNKPALTKILLELRENAITVASSDGAYMVFSYSFAGQAPAEDDILITPKVIKALEGLEDIKLHFSSKIYAFETKDVTVIVTRAEMKYVDFRKIFPPDFDSNLKIDRQQFIDALERCNINSDPYKKTGISLKKDKVNFSANDKDLGIKINVDVPAEYTGTVEEAFISCDKMLKLLNQVDFETINIALHDAKRSILLRSENDTNYIALLMPMAV